MSDNNFLLERKLMNESPALHEIFVNCVNAVSNMLDHYVEWFPTYTDHSMRHALDVIEFCNAIIGEKNIRKLNCDEAFVLLMGCYLHDSGMGISKKNFYEFIDKIEPNIVLPEDDSEQFRELIRSYHHELSGEFVKKYGEFFEIPSKEYVFCISQIARGHRKTDLYDESEYPSDYLLPDGNRVCLPYLAALIRLADEIDLSKDRNYKEMYDNAKSFNEFSKNIFNGLDAVKRVEIDNDYFTIDVDAPDEKTFESVKEMVDKARDTLVYCRSVVKDRTVFEISQKELIIKRISE